MKLVDKVTEEHFVKRGGKRVSVRRVRNVTIGTARFSLPAGASETLRVHLSSLGQALLGQVGKRVLKVNLIGTGVESGTLVLK